ncbi:MAG: SET domain-containing protein-lysine N-methyltransferase [Roseibacillus sp.]|nr:SET domain-containing protein-lysine N-methyltransferase [Roseibacillus sp.]
MGKAKNSRSGAKGKKLKDAARLRRQMEELVERAKSEYCEVRNSDIHGTGVYAAKPIPTGKRVIEYLGEKIGKEESERRANVQMEHAEKTGDAAVYIFTLNKKWDIDGNVPWNTARLLNHSCAPNCEAWIEEKQIFLYSLRDIDMGEELTFDYGFDIENYEDHPCLCGNANCVGYIVGRDHWPELKERLAEKEQANGTEEP